MTDVTASPSIAPLPGANGRYMVTTDGDVIGLHRRKIKLRAAKVGRLSFVYLPAANGRHRVGYVDEAVLGAFIGRRPEGHVAVHLNGDWSDNHLENLVWSADPPCTECGAAIQVKRAGEWLCPRCRGKKRYKRRAARGDGLRMRLKNYGITLDEYRAMVKARNGKCDICGIPPKARGDKLCVDHCHTTGDIRGLLCGRCNLGVGLLGDSLQGIERARAYFKRIARRVSIEPEDPESSLF